MESMTQVFLGLVLCVIVVAHPHPTTAETNGKELIKEVCSLAPNRTLCGQVLSSDLLTSPNATLKDLAIISLRVAARNASAILVDTKMLINDDKLDPHIQQGLADCKETILDAESQLEDTIAALMVDMKTDTKDWLKAALAAIDTCDASIPGDDDVLSVKSAGFRKLCNISISVIALLNNPAAKF
ncbi:hypothetical protein VNO78_06491 [Psophocarpus tetragonolobus]|uniref:Pectinesterase inhibitor domain-containing protein n=1 Tax=Psophocarpus tetragonolobus TaxID=3891 RepID=A0AAN9SS82_PSOTE